MQSIVGNDFISPLHDYGVELKRLRRMNAKRRLLDTSKLAHFWLRLHSCSRRKEWLRGKIHWFQGGTALEDILEKNLYRYVEREDTYRNQFINFDEDMHMMKVDFAKSGIQSGVTCEVA